MTIVIISLITFDNYDGDNIENDEDIQLLLVVLITM